MIKPTKYTNLSCSIISVTAEMIKKLKKKRVITLTSFKNEMDIMFQKKYDTDCFHFFNAIQFLYILGLVEYNIFNDSIEYINNEII